MNCSNIFKKEKALREKKENSVFSTSFIYYLNNNQNFINGLFKDLNNSKDSIIYDLNKGKDIDYLPFWLFILRNITSLNCIKYDDEEIDKEIAKKLIKKVKSELSQRLKERESLNSNWINLVLDNISSDIMNQKIHSFYNFFNSLINNLILKQEHLKEFTINELVQYFEEIIELVIKNNFEQILEQNINAKNENIGIHKKSKRVFI